MSIQNGSLTRRTLADALWPQSQQAAARVRDIFLILTGSVLVALSAKVQAPALPVPITMQPFAVLLLGAALGRTRGSLALVAYVAEGAAGFPVFAHGGGLGYLTGPTAGYLFAFPIAAFVVGHLADCGWDRRPLTTILAMTIGHAIILSLGFAWMAAYIGAQTAFVDGVLKFLPGDALKIALAAVALPTAWRFIGRK